MSDTGRSIMRTRAGDQMSKHLKANFTPVIDSIVDDLGLTAAAVFGRIWRYCQGERGECFASQETIAAKLKLSRRCVQAHIQSLVKAGYLAESEKSGVTKIYRDTGKIGFSLDIIEGTCAKNTQVGEKPAQNLRNTYAKNSQLPTQNLRIKIQEKRQDKKQRNLSLSEIDFENLRILDYKKIPELALFQEATNSTPPAGLQGSLLKIIVQTIQEKGLQKPEIETAYTKWISRGYRPDNLDGWLVEWAPAIKQGEKPWENGKKPNGSNGNGHQLIVEDERAKLIRLLEAE